MRLAAAIAFALCACSPAFADGGLTGSPLTPAKPLVTKLAPRPAHGAIDIDAGLAGWPARPSHIAGSAHYDGGEWIYEDYPITAYGAAPPGAAQAFGGLDAAGGVVPGADRLPGGSAEFQATAGSGPFVDQADVSQLRLAVRGGALYVLGRTTTMTAPVQTALLLLFDTGHAGASRAVPFGSGLTTTRADTAVLITAAGAQIADLASGTTSTAPAAADPSGYVNSLQAQLPLARLRKRGQLRFVAAAGLVTPKTFSLQSNGAGPLAKVVPRFGEPVQSVHERAQAFALAAHDIDPFFTTVSLRRLRRGDRERLAPGIGYTVRTFDAARAISHEGGTDGILRDYGLYLPHDFTGGPTPATLVLRGSSMTAHSLPAITPGLFQQLGDDNRAIVISTGGRAALDDYSGSAYRDTFQVLHNAEALLPIDRDRVTVGGYSMGGYATYELASTRPDTFAGAFVVEGPVGGAQPATKTPIVNAFPDVVAMLDNLYNTPIAIDQTEHDADVPISNALAASQRLHDLGYRYRLTVFPGDHFSPGIFNDYTTGVRYLRGLVRERHPAEVRFVRNMAFERGVDTGEQSGTALEGRSVGLRFDRAWYVHDLRPVDAKNGVAAIDVRSLARPRAAIAPVASSGTQEGTAGGEPPAIYQEQRWQSAANTPAARNAFAATLTGVAGVTLDLRGMGLDVGRTVSATIVSDADTALTVRGCGRSRTVSVPRGRHALRFAPLRGCAA